MSFVYQKHPFDTMVELYARMVSNDLDKKIGNSDAFFRWYNETRRRIVAIVISAPMNYRAGNWFPSGGFSEMAIFTACSRAIGMSPKQLLKEIEVCAKDYVPIDLRHLEAKAANRDEDDVTSADSNSANDDKAPVEPDIDDREEFVLKFKGRRIAVG